MSWSWTDGGRVGRVCGLGFGGVGSELGWLVGVGVVCGGCWVKVGCGG